jgi:3-hydroxyacyl-CoA dehydrogenase
VLSETLTYAFLLVPATVPDVTLVDEAMRIGYNWKFGPFELIDKLGSEWMAKRLKAEGRPVPAFLEKAAGKSFYRTQGGKLEYLTLEGDYAALKRPEGVLLLADVKRAGKPVEENASASLWDIGDGVLCLEFHTKANALDAAIFAMMRRATEIVGDGRGAWKGLVIHSESGAFSAGANLGVFAEQIKAGAFDKMEELLKEGQAAHHALRFAPFPTVAAPMGVAVGGGCEVLLHCSSIQAYAECAPGLVEANVGLLPGWGGVTQLLARATAALQAGTESPTMAVFKIVLSAKTASAAPEARDLFILRPTDGISMNKDRVLFDAKRKLLDLARDYHAPAPTRYALPGPTGRAALELEIESAAAKMSPHDVTIAKTLADLLCGTHSGADALASEEEMMESERKAFLTLARTPETLARIEHMLAKGKPLKN